MTTVSDFLPYFLSAGLNPKSIYKTILSPKEVKNLQNCRYWLTTFRRMRYGVVRVAKQKKLLFFSLCFAWNFGYFSFYT